MRSSPSNFGSSAADEVLSLSFHTNTEPQMSNHFFQEAVVSLLPRGSLLPSETQSNDLKFTVCKMLLEAILSNTGSMAFECDELYIEITCTLNNFRYGPPTQPGRHKKYNLQQEMLN